MPAKLTQLFLRHGKHILTIDNHLALGWLNQPVDVPDQGRFAGTGQPHHHLDLLFRDINVDVPEAKNMTVIIQQTLFCGTIAHMLHRRLRVVAKDLVEIADFDFDFSHGRPPDGAPAGAAHIPEKHGQR